MFLRTTGVALALPALEAMNPIAYAAELKAPQRMVTVCTTLGLHAPNLFPENPGADYQVTPYLEHLKGFRDDFTIFSGLSHPDQTGKDGHSSEMTWLTAAINPGLSGFRNSISLDQYAAEKLGYVTRFPSLSLSTNGSNSQSYTRGGVMIPAEHSPAKLFAKMFLQGKPDEVKRQRQLLNEGRSILDALGGQTKSLKRKVSPGDKQRLDQYFESIRQAENHFAEADAWTQKEKPKVDAEQPSDIEKDNDLIGRMNLLMDLVPLIVQTDSSRVISVVVHGRGDVPNVEGVTIDHHNLSHHGQDETKIAQLMRIENQLFRSFSRLIEQLKEKKEGNGTLLDNTMVLFGSNLGNANAHDWRNLPIIFAGGNDFQHGQYVAYDKENNQRLSNLYLTMLQKMGIEADNFGTSNATLTW